MTSETLISTKQLTIVNGGPRRGWNTYKLLEQAAAGARAQGAEVHWVNLYDLKYKGCRSCFVCKQRGGEKYGHCAQKDELLPVLSAIESSDALLIGSPIYLYSVTGETRSFLERLIFPFLAYTTPYSSVFPRKMKTGMIYTMNVDDGRAEQSGLHGEMSRLEMFMEMAFGTVERLASYDTLQFQDYGAVVADCWDAEHKAARRRDVFPEDCAKAFELGSRLVQ